jgi:[acyl-carrier-protein] S-malonyltransferase
MGKTALMFSGQGSQYNEMGLDLYNKYDTVKNTYKKASEIFGFDCIEESKTGENFLKTLYSQPCVFTLSLAIFELLKSTKLHFDGVCGFSLGECSALYASGITNLNDTIKIVNYRSIAMQKASNHANGAMMAVIGLDALKIKEVLDTLGGFCIPVNYNCEGQTVIAGDSNIIDVAEVPLKNAGAKRCVKLPVSSAFHTKYMKNAGSELKENIIDIEYNNPSIDFYTNINGEKLSEISSLSEHMEKQMTGPVYFQTLISNMVKDGYDKFIEIGPGKTLCGFVKRINKEVNILNIENVETFERISNDKL